MGMPSVGEKASDFSLPVTRDQKVDGATKLCGVWRFDPIKLERWIKHGEPKPWAPNVSAAKYGEDLSKIRAVPGGSRLRELVGL